MKTTVAVLIFAVLQILITSPALAKDLDKVVLQLRWDHQFQFAGYYCALWQGYYQEQGIDVEIRSAIKDNTILSAVDEVVSGRADFGIGAADILIARDKGKPLVVLASIFQHSAAAFFALPDTQLSSPADFTRLKVARQVDSLVDVEFQALLKAEGIDPASIKPYPHQPGLQHLLEGKVDVIPGYTISLPITAELNNISLKSLRPREYGIDFYGDSLFSTEPTIKNNLEMVERFVAATLKGWTYALNNVEEVAGKITRDLVRGAPQEKLHEFNLLQAKGVSQLIHYPEVRIGNINPDRWQKMHDFLTTIGMFHNALDIKKFIFNPISRRLEQEKKFEQRLFLILAAIVILAMLAFTWLFMLRKILARRTTELTRTQEELARQKNILSFLYNRTPVMHHSINNKGKLVYVSDYWLEVMGYERDEVIGTRSTDYLTEESRKYALAEVVPMFFQKGEVRNIRYQFVKKNGDIFDSLMNAVLVENNQIPSVSSLAAIIDVTDLRKAEKALLLSEERFTLAMNFVQDGLYDWNLETNEIYYSPSWKKMLGYEEHELPNDFSVWEKLTDPEDVQKSWLMLDDLLNHRREQFILEFKMRHKNGHWVDILSRAKVVFNEEGKGIRVVGTHIDISDRKRAEQELLQAKGRAEQYLQLAGVMFIGLDLDGKVFLANQKACEILECQLDEIIGIDWFSTFIPEQERKDTAVVFNQIISGSPVNEKYYENHVISKNGARKLIAWNNTLLTDDNGAITGALSSGSDITELHTTLTELAQQRQILNLLIDSMPVLITFYDPQAQSFRVNEEFHKVVGWSNEDLPHIDLLAECYPNPEDRAKAQEYMASGSTGWQEFTITTRYGHTIDSNWSNVLLEDGTQVYIGIDITQKKNTEEILRQGLKMEALGTLAGGIAHDFNNLLTAILGFSRLLKERVEPGSENEEDINEIITAGNRAAGLVSQILAYCRKKELHRASINLDLAIRECLKLLRATIPTTINIDFQSSADGKNVLADRTQINQLLMNLCTNAAHALEHHGDTITIRLAAIAITRYDRLSPPSLAPGNYLLLSISDNGCGIRPEHLERIFDPYFTTKDIDKGSGMGLAVVSGIVKAHHGEITVTSELGRGTTISIYLPEHERAPEDPIAVPQNLPGGQERILVVDDEPQLTSLISRSLSNRGYVVTTCSDSVEALVLYREDPYAFDLILTDQTMPNLSGDMLTRNILEINPSARVILYSGYSSSIDSDSASDTGASAYLAKPFTTEELIATIRKALESRGVAE
ncbi:PAS domain S-box protein [Desulfopila aestuarii]|uniref:histidine kinase n=1 Tax=Desulfopila aestuarii DSM 18488 TaxID=1121416 RepID=A0A1M7YJX6_9BACT|nr:PAS domain S-box protein [Desulfopila aestuarii]SHO52912.1 PAS domain S-box-containing protein [Desulfopila aestuarii DSM 18488]